MDLRGYGASDKPPRGYDPYMGARDTAALIGALGCSDAVIVGQGLGAGIAWCMPSFQPQVTRAIAALSMVHPRVMRKAYFGSRKQHKASRWIVDLQVPFAPERGFARDDSYAERFLRSWSAPTGEWPAEEDVHRYAAGMRLPFVAHSAAEHYRWIGRSQLRPDGAFFMRRIKAPVSVPVLQIAGELDSCVLVDEALGSEAYAAGQYDFRIVAGAGHFLAEEAAEETSRILVDWLATLPA